MPIVKFALESVLNLCAKKKKYVDWKFERIFLNSSGWQLITIKHIGVMSKYPSRVLPVHEWPFYDIMPRLLVNSFLELDYVFSVHTRYICLNLIDLSKKKVHFVYSKLNSEFKAKKLFARNLGMQFRRAVHIQGGL